MQTNLLWTGQAHHSLENCVLTNTETASEIDSVIIGVYQGQIYKVNYLIKTDGGWQTVFVQIKTRFADQREIFVFQRDTAGNWTKNGDPAPEFQGCIDIDISLTPFTNTLPINRLNLRVGGTQEIKALYFDVLSREIKPVRQRYTRLSEKGYKYENVPNDFEAVITVDELGLVVDYPGLFTRSHRAACNYPESEE